MTSNGMRVLVVTGDPSFKPGNPRFDLQAKAVESLTPLYLGLRTLFQAMPQGPFDVVTVQDPFWRGLFAWRIARSIGAHLNVQLHADFEAQSPVKRVIGAVVLKRADSIRVVSERIKAQVLALGVTAPITVLPIYVDLSPYARLVRTPSKEPLIVWVGRFEKEKDPLKAIETFRELIEQGVKAQLVMLGVGSLEKRLRAAAKDLPVEFPGWQNPIDYFAKASLVLSTSPAESWGASIVEALAAHVPVVTFDVGIAREAGAIIAESGKLVDTVMNTLQSPPPIELKLPVLSEHDWVTEWVESLV